MIKTFILLVLCSVFSTASGAPAGFTVGPVIADYGENITVADGLENAAEQHFKVLFDVSESNDKGGASKRFNSVARFINMHVRAGVPLEHIDVAMVVHGKAAFDLLDNGAFKTRFTKDNGSVELLNQLLASGVGVYLCGQSAAALGIDKKDLQAGVQMSLSAMTANALLQQQGYTLNPF